MDGLAWRGVVRKRNSTETTRPKVNKCFSQKRAAIFACFLISSVSESDRLSHSEGLEEEEEASEQTCRKWRICGLFLRFS